MRLNDSPVFFLSPLVLFDVWVQMVVPSLPALLANPAWEGLGDVAPIFSPEFQDIFREFFILFLTPWPLDHGWIQNLLPTMQALHVSSLIQIRRNLLPVFGSKLAHKFCQIEVFLRIPIAFRVLWLLSQCIILIASDVVGFLVCHIQAGPFLLLLKHFLHVIIALRKRLLLIGTLPASFLSKLVSVLPRARMARFRCRVLTSRNRASDHPEIWV